MKTGIGIQTVEKSECVEYIQKNEKDSSKESEFLSKFLALSNNQRVLALLDADENLSETVSKWVIKHLSNTRNEFKNSEYFYQTTKAAFDKFDPAKFK